MTADALRHAWVAGQMFRHALLRAPVDAASLGEMVGAVDDVLAELEERLAATGAEVMGTCACGQCLADG